MTKLERCFVYIAISCLLLACQVDLSGEPICSDDPWMRPVQVLSISDNDVRHPTVTADSLLMYVSVRVDGTDFDLFESSRASVRDAWSAPTPIPALSSTPGIEADPEVSPDGLTLWFISTRNGNPDIFVSFRERRSMPWGAPIAIPELDVAAEMGPSVSSSGRSMLFSSNRTGTWELFLTTRTDAEASWGTPVPLAEASTGELDFGPTESADGLEIYFTHTPDGVNSRSIYVSRRASPFTAFEPAVPAWDLDAEGDNESPWLADDCRVIYFSRRSPPQTGRYEIYMATR